MWCRTFGIAGFSVFLGCWLAAAGAVWAQEAATVYEGRAFAAGVDIPDGQVIECITDTGSLSAEGGELAVSQDQASLPGLFGADLLVASVVGGSDRTTSSASLANVVLFPGTPYELTVSFVRVEAQASVDGVSARVEISELTFGGEAIVVTGEANQVVLIPDVAILTLHEVIDMSVGDLHAIQVTAIRVQLLPTGAEVVLGYAEAGVRGGVPRPEPPKDFMTGGGWILVGGERANFGFNAGYKPNSTEATIHFNYIDHATGMHVKMTGISVYAVGASPEIRHLEGTCEINGVAGFTYVIDMADYAEPGRGVDTLHLSLSNGYAAGGTLAGGNLQLHAWHN